jgi:3-oxoacyl-[acyl-carrier-protein] synthase II
MANRRVVVTGIGVVSSIGIGKDKFWNNLTHGKSGISNIETFDTTRFENHRGGEVKDFLPPYFISKDMIKNLGRGSQLAITATMLALDDAGLNAKNVKNLNMGAIIGTTMADIQSLEQIDKHWIKNGDSDVWPINIVKYPSNSLSDHIGYFFKIRGPNYVIPTACSAGNYSIGYSFDMIKQGKADFMIAGGADPMSRITFTGFSRLYAMAPEKCQPFDKNRKGMMIGEGAGIMILETLESAEKRKATIYAEVLGYALSCDARHMTAPSTEGIISAMKKAIKDTGVNKNDVGYISAHGTGTPANDKAECMAIKEVFNKQYKDIAVSSIKSMLGHTMGAASAIEAIACCLAIKNEIVPPTINYETPDPECDLDIVPNNGRRQNVHIAFNNSSAFGGNNACVIFSKAGY